MSAAAATPTPTNAAATASATTGFGTPIHAGSVSAMRSHPSAERNRGPISDILTCYLPTAAIATTATATATAGSIGRVFEVSSGTGQHSAYFAVQFPNLSFQPTEYDAKNLPSIEAYVTAHRATTKTDNILPPYQLDVCCSVEQLPKCALDASGTIDVLININMIHITEWTATTGLMRLASLLLRPGGLLVMYGPYNIADDVFTTPSNAKFDADYLKKLNPKFGIRNMNAVIREARESGGGLSYVAHHSMPANNFMVIFVKPTTTTTATSAAAGTVTATVTATTVVAPISSLGAQLTLAAANAQIVSAKLLAAEKAAAAAAAAAAATATTTTAPPTPQPVESTANAK